MQSQERQIDNAKAFFELNAEIIINHYFPTIPLNEIWHNNPKLSEIGQYLIDVDKCHDAITVYMEVMVSEEDKNRMHSTGYEDTYFKEIASKFYCPAMTGADKENIIIFEVEI